MAPPDLAPPDLRLAIANEDDPVQQRYYQGLLATQESILQDLRQEAAELGITQEQLDGADHQAVADANANPIESEQLGFYESSGLNVLVNGAAGIGIGVGHGAAINFNNFTLGLTPWADDIRELIDENGYGVADGFSKGGVVALAAAGGLAAWPAIAEFAGSSFVLPAFRFGGGGLAFAEGGSTGGAVVIGGGVVTGTEVLGAGTIVALFANRWQFDPNQDPLDDDRFESMPAGNNTFHNGKANRIGDLLELSDDKRRLLHDEIRKRLLKNHTLDDVLKLAQDLFPK